MFEILQGRAPHLHRHPHRAVRRTLRETAPVLVFMQRELFVRLGGVRGFVLEPGGDGEYETGAELPRRSPQRPDVRLVFRLDDADAEITGAGVVTRPHRGAGRTFSRVRVVALALAARGVVQGEVIEGDAENERVAGLGRGRRRRATRPPRVSREPSRRVVRRLSSARVAGTSIPL